MQFLIEGVRRSDGATVAPFEVHANNEDAAMAIASHRFGVLVSSVTPQPPDDLVLPPPEQDRGQDRGRQNPNADVIVMLIVGGLGVLAGVAWIMAALAMKTTVASGSYGLTQTENLGLLNNRLIHAVCAGATLVSGMVLLAAGAMARVLRAK